MDFFRITKKVIKKKIGYKGKRVVILMYHRVVDVSSSPYHVIVSPDHFQQHMEHISQNYHPMRLLDLISAIEQNSLPHKGVVVTFDDGYYDNYNFAYPILEKLKIPATIFVSSAFIGTNREYWWDELERILFVSKDLPEKLDATINGIEIDLRLPTSTREQRSMTHKALHAFLRNLKPDDRDKFLIILRNWASMEEIGREIYRPMNTDEIIQLSQSNFIEIGAHTQKHPVLSTLSTDEQCDEIIGSKKAIESIINRSVDSIAYPYGDSGDFSQQTLDIVRDAGFKAACTTIKGYVTKDNDIAALPRHWIGDWDRVSFGRNLDLFFD